MINLKADEVMRLRVKLSKPEIVGSVVDGILQVIPIVGGVFSGEKIRGTVVLGGADWNTTHNDGVSHVFAKYLLLTDDGEYIAIENEGFIDSKSEATIKTKPTFVANKEGKYSFLNHGVFVGSLYRLLDSKDMVDIVIYRMR